MGDSGGAATTVSSTAVASPQLFRHHFTPYSHLIGGGIAGAFSRTFVAPLERLKVMYQTRPAGGEYKILADLRLIRESEGVKGYFRGNGANVAKIVPKTALKFYVFDHIKKLVVKEGEKTSMVDRLVAGSLAGFCAQVASQPLDGIKVRLAASKPNEMKGMVDVFTKTFRREGVVGIYRGLVPALIGVVPGIAIDLALYDKAKNMYFNYNPEHEGPPPVWYLLGSGIITSACGYAAGHPMGLAKARLQVQGMSDNYTVRYRGMTDVFRQTIKETGWLSLYSGLRPQLLKVCPAAAVAYVVYENTVAFFKIEA